MSVIPESDVEMIRDLVGELRERFGAYSRSPDLSRVMIAQCDAAMAYVNADDGKAAHAAFMTIMAGCKAAGGMAWTAGL